MNKYKLAGLFLMFFGFKTALGTTTDPATTLNSDLNATAASYSSNTTSSISIAPRDNLIIATTVTNWDIKASDMLAIYWTAPQGSYCKNSKFTLVRGPNTHHDVSWAYRTVVHTNAQGRTTTCQGHWLAQVVNVNTGKILASAGYDVSPLNKPPLSGDNTLSSAAPDNS
jgi:hypothetical protein